MSTNVSTKLGAACGVAFPLALMAGRDRSGTFMLGALGLVLFVPYLAYLCSLLRAVERPGGWLTSCAFGAGLMGMTLKLASGVPELAYRSVPKGSQAYHALDGLASGATVVSLYPFGIFMAVVAYLSLRAGALPRWLGVFAALTSVALLVNGSFKHAGTVPALLLFIVWSLVAGAALLIRELRLGATDTATAATAQ
jgi:uncharacterized membrane protein YhaH (DUF805 family)